MLSSRLVRARSGLRSLHAASTSLSNIKEWSKVDPVTLSAANPAELSNLVNGEWTGTPAKISVVDPLNGEVFIQAPDTRPEQCAGFIEGLRSTPKSGRHNPLKRPERYLLYGRVAAEAAARMREPEVEEHFVRLIQRVVPKSTAQAQAEVRVTRAFLENFSGDQVRFLARGFSNPGDHPGQSSHGYRWPYGGVAVIAPFNFPLEIPALQMMGALFMGNRPVVHADVKVAVVLEEFVRLLHACGMPVDDLDLFHGRGDAMEHVLLQGRPRSTLFTGSQRVAERLSLKLGGRVFLEDAGFDWKILGPDVRDVEHVAWQCDQDAYACTGQKCSAQSILFMHENWARAGLEARLAALAARRSLEDFTVGPVLSWTTPAILAHVERLAAIAGARVAWGGRE
ncbi:aldehyde dehydrogenase, partial [Helicosporidium sp. ATCC 50920]